MDSYISLGPRSFSRSVRGPRTHTWSAYCDPLSSLSGRYHRGVLTFSPHPYPVLDWPGRMGDRPSRFRGRRRVELRQVHPELHRRPKVQVVHVPPLVPDRPRFPPADVRDVLPGRPKTGRAEETESLRHLPDVSLEPIRTLEGLPCSFDSVPPRLLPFPDQRDTLRTGTGVEFEGIGELIPGWIHTGVRNHEWDSDVKVQGLRPGRGRKLTDLEGC